MLKKTIVTAKVTGGYEEKLLLLNLQYQATKSLLSLAFVNECYAGTIV